MLVCKKSVLYCLSVLVGELSVLYCMSVLVRVDVFLFVGVGAQIVSVDVVEYIVVAVVASVDIDCRCWLVSVL